MRLNYSLCFKNNLFHDITAGLSSGEAPGSRGRAVHGGVRSSLREQPGNRKTTDEDAP